MIRPILITGCQRSGTTLLSLVLDSHRSVTSIDEMDFTPPFQDYLESPDYPANLVFKLPTYAHSVESFNALSDARTIWCMRQPLDVIRSMIRLKILLDGALVSWTAHPGGANRDIESCYDAAVEILPDDVKEQIAEYRRMVENDPVGRSHADLVRTAALCWTLKQWVLRLYESQNTPLYLVRYEELVTRPRETIGGVLDFLGLDWDDDLLRHHELHAGVAVGGTEASRHIDTQSLAAGRGYFSQEERELIRSICGETMAHYGYEIAAGGNGHSPGSGPVLVAAQAAFSKSQFGRVIDLLLPELAKNPTDLQARSMMINACVGREDYRSALEHLEAALKQAPGASQLKRVAGAVLNRLGSDALKQREFERSSAYLKRALEMDSGQMNARYNLGVCLLRSGRPEQALRTFSMLPTAQQAKPDTLYYGALCEQALGRPGAALETAQKATAGADSDLLLRIADLLAELDAHEHVLRICDLAESAGGDPERVGTLRARIRLMLGDVDQATGTLDQLAATNPESTHVQHQLIHTNVTLGRLGDATRIALGRDPSTLGFTWLTRALWEMPPVPESVAHIDELRSQATTGLQRLREDRPAPARALEELGWSNFYLSYQGRDNRSLKSAWGEIVRREAAALRPELLEPHRDWGRANPKPRVGFLSSRWANTVIGNYFGPWIGALTDAGFETFLYVVPRAIDDLTHQLQARASETRMLYGDTEVSARAIRADCLDLLIIPEVGAETRITALAALRLAKKQAAGWGLPDTTGLSTVGYFLTQDETERADAQEDYSEQLIRLPQLGIAYPHPPEPSGKQRGDFGLPENKRLYLFPHSAFKTHPETDAVCAAILASDNDGLLVCFESEKPLYEKLLSARMTACFREHGVDYAERVLVRPQMPRDDYLAMNTCCDVMVDNLHFSGGNTTLDALSVGLPVVTLPGRFMRGRQSEALLTSIGAQDLVAGDSDNLAAKAVTTARGYDRQELRDRAQRLFDNPAGLEGLVTAIAGLLEAD